MDWSDLVLVENDGLLLFALGIDAMGIVDYVLLQGPTFWKVLTISISTMVRKQQIQKTVYNRP